MGNLFGNINYWPFVCGSWKDHACTFTDPLEGFWLKVLIGLLGGVGAQKRTPPTDGQSDGVQGQSPVRYWWCPPNRSPAHLSARCAALGPRAVASSAFCPCFRSLAGFERLSGLVIELRTSASQWVAVILSPCRRNSVHSVRGYPQNPFLYIESGLIVQVTSQETSTMSKSQAQH